MRKIVSNITIKKKKLFVLFMALAVFLFYGSSTVFANKYDEIAQIMYDNSMFFKQNSAGNDILRIVGWMIVKGLRWLANNCQSLYKKTLGIADFSSYPDLTAWIEEIKVVCVAIMALSLMYYGIILIVNHNKKNNILHSVMLTGLCCSALTSIMLQANDAVISFCGEVTVESMADSVIQNNLYDLLYIDQLVGLANISSDNESLKTYHYETSDFNFDTIDITEVINYEMSGLSEGAAELLSYGVTYFPLYESGDQGFYIVEDVYNGWGWNSGDDDDWFNEFYYRYHTTGFPIVVALSAIIIVFLCVSYKTAKLLWELPLKGIIALFYSHDMTGTQKVLKILGNIKDSYIILMICSISLKMFSIFEKFLSEKFVDDPFTYSILLLFVAFAIIDAPNIVQTLTGEDAGLQTGFSRIVSAYQGANGIRKKITGTAAGLGKAAVSGGVSHHRYKKMMEGLNGKKNSNIPDGVSGSDSNKDVMEGMNENKENATSKENLNTNGEKDNPNEDIKNSGLGDGQQTEESAKASNLDSNRELNEQERASNPMNTKAGKNNPLETIDPSSNKKSVSGTNEDMRKAMTGKSGNKNGNISSLNGKENLSAEGKNSMGGSTQADLNGKSNLNVSSGNQTINKKENISATGNGNIPSNRTSQKTDVSKMESQLNSKENLR